MALPKTSVLKERECKVAGKSDVEIAETLVQHNTTVSRTQANATFKLAENPVECIGEYVAIIPVAAKNETSGGIIVPDQAQGVQDTGIIVGVGSEAMKLLGSSNVIGRLVKFGARNSVCNIKAGDIPDYAECEIKIISVKSIFCFLSKQTW